MKYRYRVLENTLKNGSISYIVQYKYTNLFCVFGWNDLCCYSSKTEAIDRVEREIGREIFKSKIILEI
jgi:hypothetical protein